MKLTKAQKEQRALWKNPPPVEATREQARALFDENGNFKNYDPYRRADDLFFNKDGWPVAEVLAYAQILVDTKELDHFCDAVKILHACAFARCTKGNYSPCYMWRR